MSTSPHPVNSSDVLSVEGNHGEVFPSHSPPSSTLDPLEQFAVEWQALEHQALTESEYSGKMQRFLALCKVRIFHFVVCVVINSQKAWSSGTERSDDIVNEMCTDMSPRVSDEFIRRFVRDYAIQSREAVETRAEREHSALQVDLAALKARGRELSAAAAKQRGSVASDTRDKLLALGATVLQTSELLKQAKDSLDVARGNGRSHRCVFHGPSLMTFSYVRAYLGCLPGFRGATTKPERVIAWQYAWDESDPINAIPKHFDGRSQLADGGLSDSGPFQRKSRAHTFAAPTRRESSFHTVRGGSPSAPFWQKDCPGDRARSDPYPLLDLPALPEEPTSPSGGRDTIWYASAGNTTAKGADANTKLDDNHTSAIAGADGNMDVDPAGDAEAASDDADSNVHDRTHNVDMDEEADARSDLDVSSDPSGAFDFDMSIFDDEGDGVALETEGTDPASRDQRDIPFIDLVDDSGDEEDVHDDDDYPPPAKRQRIASQSIEYEPRTRAAKARQEQVVCKTEKDDDGIAGNAARRAAIDVDTGAVEKVTRVRGNYPAEDEGDSGDDEEGGSDVGHGKIVVRWPGQCDICESKGKEHQCKHSPQNLRCDSCMGSRPSPCTYNGINVYGELKAGRKVIAFFNGEGFSFPIIQSSKDREEAERRLREIVTHWREPVEVHHDNIMARIKRFEPPRPNPTTWLYGEPGSSQPAGRRAATAKKRTVTERDAVLTVPSSSKPAASISRTAVALSQSNVKAAIALPRVAALSKSNTSLTLDASAKGSPTSAGNGAAKSVVAGKRRVAPRPIVSANAGAHAKSGVSASVRPDPREGSVLSKGLNFTNAPSTTSGIAPPIKPTNAVNAMRHEAGTVAKSTGNTGSAAMGKSAVKERASAATTTSSNMAARATQPPVAQDTSVARSSVPTPQAKYVRRVRQTYNNVFMEFSALRRQLIALRTQEEQHTGMPFGAFQGEVDGQPLPAPLTNEDV
ncbi:hypothetical protein C8Q77DRAFT_1156927 [Trametes polyzona]|nr:hypothetical protein C8Q77DRAFT_1156927 [Trametes polyzona]